LQESAKRAVRPLKQKTDLVSIEMLLELCNMNVGNNDLLVVRDLTMILLSFAGFLRFDEVSSLLCSDVKIECEYLFLFIRNDNISIFTTVALPATMPFPYPVIDIGIGCCCRSTRSHRVQTEF
jgi:hypothetical protein